MIYCEGKYCARRDQCAFHEHFEWEYPRQYLDQSTQGMGYEGIDKSGKSFSHHEFFCGDKADYYKRYKALGWREGQEYKNSEGFKYDETCLTCEHHSLCFCLLEYAGLITEEGKRIMCHSCEYIKEHADEKKQMLRSKFGDNVI